MKRFFDNAMDANAFALSKADDGFVVTTRDAALSGYRLFFVEFEPDSKYKLLIELLEMLPTRLDKLKREVKSPYDAERDFNRGVHDAILEADKDLSDRLSARRAVLRKEARLFVEARE